MATRPRPRIRIYPIHMKGGKYYQGFPIEPGSNPAFFITLRDPTKLSASQLPKLEYVFLNHKLQTIIGYNSIPKKDTNRKELVPYARKALIEWLRNNGS